MKLIKKIAAIMFAFMMVFTLSSNVNAEETTGTGKITIDNAIPGETYTIYKIFDLESFSGSNYSYKVTNDQWKDFFTNGPGNAYVNINDYYGVTWKNENSTETEKANLAKKLAPIMLNFAKDPKKGITGKPLQADSKELVFDKLPLGYYLVDSSVGALCGLTTTANEITIYEKNQTPTLNKYVNTSEYFNFANRDSLKKNTTNEIGDVVYFTAEINNFKGADSLVFTDTMDSGLSLGGINENNQLLPQVSLVKKDKIDNLEYGDSVDLKYNQDWTTTFNILSPEGGKDNFTLKFTVEGLKKLQENYENYVLRISYHATVNKNAKINNANTATLTYGNSQTVTSTAHVGVLSITVLKTKTDGTPLPYAEFSLYTSKDNAVKGVNPIEFKKDDNSKEIYRKATADETNAADKTTTNKIITNSDGEFTFYGLKEGPYYLKEIKAPEGYNKLNEPIEVIVTKKEDTTKKIIGYSLRYSYGNTSENGVEKVKVINKTGSLLPSTGGMGTTLIYLVGGALVLGSGFVLANKKRAKAK